MKVANPCPKQKNCSSPEGRGEKPQEATSSAVWSCQSWEEPAGSGRRRKGGWAPPSCWRCVCKLSSLLTSTVTLQPWADSLTSFLEKGSDDRESKWVLLVPSWSPLTSKHTAEPYKSSAPWTHEEVTLPGMTWVSLHFTHWEPMRKPFPQKSLWPILTMRRRCMNLTKLALRHCGRQKVISQETHDLELRRLKLISVTQLFWTC